MKAIIFGASGQDGFYLAELLKRQGVEVIGTSRTAATMATAAAAADLVGDVSDWPFVENLIRTHQPDFVFHLAASSTTRHEALFDNHAAIATGTINILEAVYRHCPRRSSKVFLSGSAMQFENDGTGIDENTPFAALSPYAVSRIHSVYAGRYYRSLGLKVYVGYFFNHDSAFRTDEHINQKIALAAQKIASGSDEKLEIGDITVEKEFNFAGDVMDAVWLLVSQDEVFEAVIGSGKTHTIEEWLDLCFGSVNLNWRNCVTIKESFASEYRVLVSNPTLIKSLGWRPKVNINDLAKMMMEK